MKYRAEIDGLRALAVLPVIFFHAGFEWFSGGFVGVDVFFVISGYLITSIIISEIAEEKFSIVNFYERRARRILPALFFVMAVSTPFAWFWLSPSDLKDFGQSLVAVSFFSSNFLFWLESGYFDTAAELKPLLHTWSLAVEEQYYILFPLFIIVTWSLGIKTITYMLALIFLASITTSYLGSTAYPSAAFFLLPARAWELLIGVFIAIYLRNGLYLKSFSANQTLSLIGFGMVVFSIIAYDEFTPFPSIYALVPALGTGLLILCSVPKTLTHNILSFKPIVGIGLISYSAYLWHQPLLAFARLRSFGDISEFYLFLLCALSIFFAWISWKYIEQPFRDKSITSRKTIFSFAAFGMLLFSLLGTSAHLKDGFVERASFSEELKSSFKRPSIDGCFDIPYNHIAEEWGCRLGANKENIDFIIFGDSHSLSLKTYLNKLGKEKDISLFFTGSSGCVPFLGVFPERKDQYENNCNILNQRVYDFAQKQQVKGIILAARWSYYTHGDYNFKGAQLISNKINGPFSLENSIDTFSSAFNRTIDKYISAEIPVHIITQPPHQEYRPESFYFFLGKSFTDIESGSVKKEKFNKLSAVPNRTFKSRPSDFNLYDITDIYCVDEICPIGTTTESYYYDDNHLSSFGAERMYGVLDNILSD